MRVMKMEERRDVQTPAVFSAALCLVIAVVPGGACRCATHLTSYLTLCQSEMEPAQIQKRTSPKNHSRKKRSHCGVVVGL